MAAGSGECVKPGCTNVVRALGLCRRHYREKRLDGRVCIRPDCGRPQFARELCSRHYEEIRALEHWDGSTRMCECGCGRETPISTVTDPRRDAVLGRPRRFLPGHNARVGMAELEYRIEDRGFVTPCWIWQRGTTNGYGATNGGRGAHRVFYEREKGPIPERWVVHHLCWNKLCVNPEHLQAATLTANSQGCLNGPDCTEARDRWVPRPRGRQMRLEPGELPYEVRDEGYETACWMWRRPLAKGGYARIHLPRSTVPAGKSRDIYAHRHYYEQHRGPIPAGLVLDHLCNNASCVNPGHLEVVTQKENLRRKIERQRLATLARFTPSATPSG